MKAVVMLEVPLDWRLDLQVMSDLLVSTGHVKELAQDGIQHVKFIACNFDFTFVNAHPLPRYGPGAFVEILSWLFNKVITLGTKCFLAGF